METLHRGESQIDALKRLIQEELDGLPGIEIESIPHGEYWIASARATLYVGHTRARAYRLSAKECLMSEGTAGYVRRMHLGSGSAEGMGNAF